MFNPFRRKKKNIEKEVVITSCVFHCLKEKCPQWVVLSHMIKVEGSDKPTFQPVGKCAMAWIPQLLVELKETIARRG